MKSFESSYSIIKQYLLNKNKSVIVRNKVRDQNLGEATEKHVFNAVWAKGNARARGESMDD